LSFECNVKAGNAFLTGKIWGNIMSVKIEWQIFTAETRSDGSWSSNSPALAELLNAIASPEKIKGSAPDIENAMAHLAIKGLPYFKITEVTSGNNREKYNTKMSSGTTC
jgi:hypothetical protein